MVPRWQRGYSLDYDYSPEELLEWAGTVEDLARQAHEVHVMFNNNAKGAGTQNAMALGNAGVSPEDPPPLPPEQVRLFGGRQLARRARKSCHSER